MDFFSACFVFSNTVVPVLVVVVVVCASGNIDEINLVFVGVGVVVSRLLRLLPQLRMRWCWCVVGDAAAVFIVLVCCGRNAVML